MSLFDAVKSLFADPPRIEPPGVFKAIEEGNVQTLKQFVNTGIDVNAEFEGHPLINYAVQHQKAAALPEILRILCKAGCIVDSRDGNHWRDTALMDLCSWATPNLEAINVLLANGVRINAKNKMGVTAASKTATYCSHVVLQLLIDSGANLMESRPAYMLSESFECTIIWNLTRSCDVKSRFDKYLALLVKNGINNDLIKREGGLGFGMSPVKWAEMKNKEAIPVLRKYGFT